MFVGRDDAQDFLEGRFAIEDAADAGFPEGGHAAAAGQFLESAGGEFIEDGGADGVIDDHDFAEGGTADESGIIAGGAAGAAAEGGLGGEFRGDEAEQGGVGLVGFGAGGAIATDQAEAEDTGDTGGEEEGFDAHVDETGEDAGGAAGVDGGDDEVSGEAGLDGDGGGFGIADFADEDDLGVLAHEGAEGDGVGEIAGGIDLGLADHGQVEFDGVFDGADADFGAIALDDVAEGGIHGGGFAGAGGAGEEDQTVGTGDQVDQGLEAMEVEAEAAEVEGAAGGIEEADDDFFAAHGGEDGDAEFGAAEFGVGGGVAFLGQFGAEGDQVGHDLEASGDFVHEVEGEMDQFGEDTVEAHANDEGLFPGFDMEVAGAGLDGIDDEVIDQGGDVQLIGGNGHQVPLGLVHGRGWKRLGGRWAIGKWLRVGFVWALGMGLGLLRGKLVRILLISPLYPPLHAGTNDLRAQAMAEALKVRGHEVRVLTSTHGLQGSQLDEEIERRLILAGAFGHPWVSGLSAMEGMESENHRALREALAGFRPESVLVSSLKGLSKSLVFGLHQSGVPSVFGVSDDWMVPGLAEDPWLRWWNAPGMQASRAALELGGKRRRLDRTAPTRLARGYDRIPELYGPGEASGGEVRWVAGFRFDALYFASRDLQERAVRAGFRVGEMPVIPDAVATSVFQGAVADVGRPLQRVMVMGPFGPTSGLDTVLAALKALGEEGRRMELTAYGRGESGLLAPLRSYAVQHGLKFQLMAPSDEGREMAGMLHRQDLLVDAREHAEGSALRLTQAMACGLPVVSTGLGAAADWVVPEETGLCFSPGNYEQLAQQWLRLCRDPAMRVRLATAGQARVNAEANETIVLDRIEDQMQRAREMRATS